jgi:YD repeat-containing protein
MRANLRGVKITDNSGNCVVGYSYDDGGNKIERVNRDLDGNLLEDKSGVATTRWSYDARGGVVETKYLDAHDRLIRNAGKNWSSAGVAVVRGKHNALGDAIETNFFDADGRLKENAVGVTTILSSVDANGNTVEKKYLGADGKPRAAKGSGAAVFQWEFDQYGGMTGMKTFDAHGRLVEEHHYVPQLDQGNQYSNFRQSARF